MAKKHIDELTLKEIDYAVAVAQGWHKEGGNWCNRDCQFKGYVDNYDPTTNQAQCGDLIDKFSIATRPKNKKWIAQINANSCYWHESRLVAACKAFLWSKYPDGMIPIEETKNE